MRAGLVLLPLLASMAAPAAAQQNVPYLQPGVYSASFTCGGAAPVIVHFYVLDQFEPGSSPDRNRYQRVRVEAGDSLFSGKAFLHGGGGLRIMVTQWERTSAKGWGAYPDGYDFAGRFEDLHGVALGSREVIVAGGGRERRSVECPMRPSPGSSRLAKSLASMSHAVTPEPVKVDHSLHRGGVPADYAPFTPDPQTARALSGAVAGTIADDSQSWLLHRLKPGTVSDFHYFSSRGDPSSLFVWASYTYVAGDGWDSRGSAAVRFVNGSVECVKFHNKASCTRPRISRSAQVAQLGGGRRGLGPMTVAARCFQQETRMESRSREKVVYADRKGNVDTETQHYSVPVTVTVFRCPSQTYQLDCVAQGTDRLTEWMTGTGTTRQHRLAFRTGQETGISAADISNYNRRIGNGSCVRTQ